MADKKRKKKNISQQNEKDNSLSNAAGHTSAQ
jgi:hypothetical protein